jgi:hypothetical protein
MIVPIMVAEIIIFSGCQNAQRRPKSRSGVATNGRLLPRRRLVVAGRQYHADGLPRAFRAVNDTGKDEGTSRRAFFSSLLEFRGAHQSHELYVVSRKTVSQGNVK